MKYIEIKSEGYTYRYDFEPVPSIVATLLCTSLPACGVALQMSNKKWRSSKLDAIFTAHLRRERDLNETSNSLQNTLCFNILFHTQVFEIT